MLGLERGTRDHLRIRSIWDCLGRTATGDRARSESRDTFDGEGGGGGYQRKNGGGRKTVHSGVLLGGRGRADADTPSCASSTAARVAALREIYLLHAEESSPSREWQWGNGRAIECPKNFGTFSSLL
jgi:hypothetical protein